MPVNRQKIVLDMLDSEMGRFYTRFNIFSAVHIGALIGFISNANILVMNTGLFRLALFVMNIFSIVGAIAVFRGYDLQQTYINTLKVIEKSYKKKDRLLEIAVPFMKLPLFFNNKSIFIFSVLMCLFWIVSWIYLEIIKFNIDIPA